MPVDRRHWLLPFGPSREFAFEHRDLSEVDQLVECFGVPLELGRHVVRRAEARPRLELLEVKAFRFPDETSRLLRAAGIDPEKLYRQPKARGEFLDIAGAMFELGWRELLDLEGNRGDYWPLIDDMATVRSPLVVACSECGRWNYHLASCSRSRGLR